MYIDYTIIGKRIRDRRRSRHISQEKLAEMIDKSTVFISNLENGKKGASLESIVSICNVLDLSIDELIIGTQNIYDDKYVDIIISVFQHCTDMEKLFLTELVIYADDALKKYILLRQESFFTKKTEKP